MRRARVSGWSAREERTRFAPSSSSSRAVTVLPRLSPGSETSKTFTRKSATSRAAAASWRARSASRFARPASRAMRHAWKAMTAPKRARSATAAAAARRRSVRPGFPRMKRRRSSTSAADGRAPGCFAFIRATSAARSGSTPSTGRVSPRAARRSSSSEASPSP